MVRRMRRSGWRRPALVALAAAPMALAACGGGTQGSASGGGGSSKAAASYPAGSINLIAPVSAGSNGDLIARQAAKDLHVGVPVSVVDRAGAAGISGITQVVQASADGGTLGLVPNGALLLQSQMKKLPYGEPSTYTAIAQISEEFDALLVSSGSKWQTISQFLAYAKANPGKLKVEVAPVGSVPNIDVRLLEKLAGVQFTLVPGVASAGAVTDLLGGHVDAVVGTINSAQSYIQAHKMAALAVMAPSRLSAYPTVPTLKETGYDVEVPVRNFVIGPPHLPSSTVAELVTGFRAAVQSSDFQSFATNTGVTVSFVSGSALSSLISSEYSDLGGYIKQFYSSSGS